MPPKDQTEFVRWWEDSVRDRGKRANVSDQKLFVDQAEAQTGITKLQVQPSKNAGLVTMLETEIGLNLETFNSIAEDLQLPSLQSGFLFRLKCMVAKTDLPPPEEVKWADHNAEDEDCCCEDCYDRRGWPPREPYVYVPHIRLLVKGTTE